MAPRKSMEDLLQEKLHAGFTLSSVLGRFNEAHVALGLARRAHEEALRLHQEAFKELRQAELEFEDTRRAYDTGLREERK